MYQTLVVGVGPVAWHSIMKAFKSLTGLCDGNTLFTVFVAGRCKVWKCVTPSRNFLRVLHHKKDVARNYFEKLALKKLLMRED